MTLASFVEKEVGVARPRTGKNLERYLLHIFRTLQAFRGVDPKTIRKLYKLYRLDFELFGFSAVEYLALNKS